MLEIGKSAPQFGLNNSDGEELKLSDFVGKWVILYFYPKDDTPGCTKEACDFTDLKVEYAKLDGEIIGISPDNASKHQEFIDKYKLKINLLSDEEKSVMKQYDAWGMKKNYGKEYEGVIRTTYIIDPEQKIAAGWKNVRVRVKRKSGEVKHAEIVKEKLEELQGI